MKVLEDIYEFYRWVCDNNAVQVGGLVRVGRHVEMVTTVSKGWGFQYVGKAKAWNGQDA